MLSLSAAKTLKPSAAAARDKGSPMNTATIVRVDADSHGVRMRLWIDDEFGRHVTVCELSLGKKALRAWAGEADQVSNDEAQEQLPYEQ